MTVEQGGRAVLAAAAATVLALLGMSAPAQAAPTGTTGATGPALVTPVGMVLRPNFTPKLGAGGGARPGGRR